MTAKILLSFDTEEFDLPREHGGEISVKDGVKVSSEGIERILELLEKRQIIATFFTTANFALENPDLTRRILAAGHEVACHGVDHFTPKKGDIVKSKQILEKILNPTKTKSPYHVSGYRQPRMFPIDYAELEAAGYLYDSSVNPAFIPGRYNHLDTPTAPYKVHNVLEIPVSVATPLRTPLFWLALHIFPFHFYLHLAKKSLKKTGYFATYFHPWEFTDLDRFKEVPTFIKINSNQKLLARLDQLIAKLQSRGYEFTTYADFAKNHQKRS
ncbi:polysaccharide deacetylase family protein [Candidatus Saccharibacteria bacterium]|nr:polysaccharide deacetylase family protein [Candidatus Saccharibacteria bacterium]